MEHRAFGRIGDAGCDDWHGSGVEPSMNQVHDIGARFGDGPVCKAVDPEPVFSENW